MCVHPFVELSCKQVHDCAHDCLANVMLPYELNHCSGMIPSLAIVSVSYSVQCWALID